MRHVQPGFVRLLHCVSSFMLISFCSASAHAVTPSENVQRIVLDIENDSLLMRREDGWYTSGVQLALQRIAFSDTEMHTDGWRLGQQLYTNRDIKLRPGTWVDGDHPYAGLIYFGWAQARIDSTGRMFGYGLDLTCLGPCAGGERSQTALHRLLRQPLPQGWAAELRQEWGANAHFEYAPGRVLPWPNADVTPTLRAQIGMVHTDAWLALMYRHRLAGARADLQPGASGGHVFARLEAGWVAHDATVQGAYFRSDPAGMPIRHGVGELEAGVVWQAGGYGVRASWVRQSGNMAHWSRAAGAENFARLQIFADY